MTEPARTSPDWDARYATDDYAYGTAPNDFLVEVAPRLAAGRTLCLAEGEGRNGVYLAGLGHDVTAVDQSGVGLEKARRLAAARGVGIRTVAADLADFAIEHGAWDTVVLIFAHLPPDLRRRVHRAAVEGLRPGGALVLEAYAPEQLELRTGGPPGEERLMRLTTLREELRGLDMEVAREVRREIREGRLHHGMSAVVQILGFRPGGDRSGAAAEPREGEHG